MHQHNEYTRSSLDIFRLVCSPHYLETPASRYETACWACRGLTVPKDLDCPPSCLPWPHLSSNRPSPSSAFMLPTSLNCADIVHNDRNCSPDHRRTIMTCHRSVLPATADVDYPCCPHNASMVRLFVFAPGPLWPRTVSLVDRIQSTQFCDIRAVFRAALKLS